jgi:protein kinase
MKERKNKLNEIEIRNIMFQTLQGIHYMHSVHKYFHRDLKPENLLEFKGTVKIADFGLAKLTNSSPPFTEYVSTRWYRSPELILKDNNYGTGLDIWALGCIMAELL